MVDTFLKKREQSLLTKVGLFLKMTALAMVPLISATIIHGEELPIWLKVLISVPSIWIAGGIVYRKPVTIKLRGGGTVTVAFGRSAFWLWLKHRFFRVAEGALLPWYAQWVRNLLFPLRWLAWMIYNNAHSVRYDYKDCGETLTIRGVTYSMEFFEELGRKGIPVGKPFVVLQRDPNGLVVIRDWVPPVPGGCYQPTHSDLDENNPPRGGSGVPRKGSR